MARAFAVTSDSPTTFNLNANLKKGASLYLSDDPELVEKIKKKEYTHKDVVEIIKVYNEYMEKKLNQGQQP